MLSGGLDSLGMLHVLLNQPEYSQYDLHVHHINILNQEGRDEVESRAVEDILAYYSPNPRLSYSESTCAFPTFNGGFPWDTDIVAFTAGNICSFWPDVKHIAIGRTKSDGAPYDPVSEWRFQRSCHVISMFTIVKKLFPVVKYTKREIYDFLPKEVRDLSWSCRTPRTDNGVYVACGACKTCLEELPLLRS
jgi:7-cyano-7-deazaguanine synthase in queuosine biosynthesis